MKSNARDRKNTTAPTQFLEANGVRYTYREFGSDRSLTAQIRLLASHAIPLKFPESATTLPQRPISWGLSGQPKSFIHIDLLVLGVIVVRQHSRPVE
jgi:hypothetical protein